MESYRRFDDPNYKHWLQTAESLCILRSHIRQFVETETEAYHRSLREQLKDRTCKAKCSLLNEKKVPICDSCEQWKDAIKNHSYKGMNIIWINCQPQLWPTNKWEVAKPFMIRGVKKHHSFDQFDISAILNFMSRCKHFKDFIEVQPITKVINVRNQVMHSPAFSLSKEEMDNGLKYVQELAKILEKHEPGLKIVSENIQQFKGILEKMGGQVSQSTEDSKKESLKLLDREQHALKEKIEFLAQCYENGHSTELKIQVELQGIKNFLEQNKDLLENLGPQLILLNEIQEKVNKHEQDIDKLNTRVNRLETVAPDPLFSGDVLKFKNHLLEEAQTRNMPEPEFTEEREANGFRGFVNVNGQTFRGLQVCNKKINAHQEVAKIALEYMNSHPEWKEETTTSLSSSASSSSTIYYGTVTVVLENQKVVSDSCDHAEEACESAYIKLARQFSLMSHAGNTFRTTVLEHFQRWNFPAPLERSVCQDNKTLCTLLLSGGFTFYDKDGSPKKKQAEQQAATVALHNLSEILNCRSLDNAGDNWKGFLKERLDALGLQQPEYDFKIVCNRPEVEEASTTDDSSQISLTKVNSNNNSIQSKIGDSEVQERPTVHTAHSVDRQETETLDSSPPEKTNQLSKMDSSGTIYYGIVTVSLNNHEVVSDVCVQKDEATESAYRKLACLFSLKSVEGKTAVREYFQRYNFSLPLESLSPAGEDNKFFCKLQLSGDFTFFDKDGSSKKKPAEQQAAKVALQHLSGLFNCSFKDEAGKNYKGFLKEQLDARHLKNPVYSCREKGGISEEMEASSTSGDNAHSSCMTAFSQNFCLQPNNNFSQECVVKETQDEGLLDIPNMPPNMDNTAINTLLVLFDLKPPSVTIESFKTERIFSCRVNINLEKFTFQNNSVYTSKKVTIRKTYLLLGNTLGISKTKLDENNASMLVKEHFSQKSLTLPKEVFEGNKCSLNDITYDLVYDGEGSTETEAQQDALHKALDMLTLLFGFNSLPKCSTVEDTVRQINSLLKTKGQKDLICAPKHNLYKSSAELLFKDYTMERKHKSNKKENVNHLSKCILGLLAVDTDPNTLSLRNCLDDWFKQKNLKQPVFENTEEVHGSKVTFSVQVSCSSPNREDSVKVAEEKLVEELRKRFGYLTD